MRTFTEEDLLADLQSQLDAYLMDAKRYGVGSSYTVSRYDAMMACKEMVQHLIEKPVFVQIDGVVTVGI